MPGFRFNVRAGEARPDPIGTDLPAPSSARVEALRLAGEIVRDAAARADVGEAWRIEVMNGAGLTLFVVEFSMPEEPTPPGRPLRH